MKTTLVNLPGDEFQALSYARFIARKEGTPFITALRDNERILRNQNHPLYGASKNWAKRGLAAGPIVLGPVETGISCIALDAIETVLADVGDQLQSIHHVVAWTEDDVGHVCRQYTVECRTIRSELLLEDKVEWGPNGFYLRDDPKPLSVAPTMVLPEAPILHQPCSAKALQLGMLDAAMTFAQKEETMLSQRIFRLARAESEKKKAIEAFKVLFEHYSLNEELWRLRGWMERFLPFTLEEAPELQSYFQLLEKQVGHIDALTDFYAHVSPSHVVDDSFVKTAHFRLAPRYQWLIDECRKRGYKRVIELGSVDGVSLFPLMQAASDIEWHGAEVSKEAVAHGVEVALRNGLTGNGLPPEKRFNLHHVDALTTSALNSLCQAFGHFDAAFVSEVLEHNSPYEGATILEAAECTLRPGGHVFISTPNGNWSICDEKTRDLELRKDHINAYTEKRMRKFIETQTCAEFQTIEVKVVENPDFWEANSWVFASYQVP